MINIVIFGAPGVGKGTQAKLLAEKYDFLHISTGDLLRQEVQMKTTTGLRAQAIMNRGDLVGDGFYVAGFSDNEEKKRALERIAERLQINFVVEILDSDGNR